MTDWNPQPGDWVKITAKVVALPPNGVDIAVELFGEGAQHEVDIRRDRFVEPAEKPIPDEPGEGSVVLVGGEAYQRDDARWWVAGRTAPVSWQHLQDFGDVEVIHHG